MVIGEEGEATHVYVLDGVRCGAAWYLGGHVERPSAWHVTLAEPRNLEGFGLSFADLESAKRWVEQVWAGEHDG